MSKRLRTAEIALALAIPALGPPLVRELAAEELHTGASYDAIAALPDWSGAWQSDPVPSVLQTASAVPLTPEFAAKLAKLRAGIKAGGPMPANPHCRPSGMPLFMDRSGALLSIAVAPGQRVVFASGAQEMRIVYLDGRGPPSEDSRDFFDGHSIGHWEGDTLVADTYGILDSVDVLPGIANGGGLHVSERIRRIGPDKLEDKITLTSPTVFTKPYSYTRTFTRHRDWEVTDYVCLDMTNPSDYGGGPVARGADKNASTQAEAPVRRVGHPAPDAATLLGGSWAAIAKLPDWSRPKGIWDYDRILNETQTNTPIPMRKPYDVRLAELRKISAAGGDIPTNNYHCWPRGALQSMKAAETAWFFVFEPGLVQMVPFDALVRRIYTDGRPHPDKLVPSFNGHSTGHWEDATLVVDTVGLRPDMQIFNGMNSGGPMHVAERVHQIAPNKLQIDTAVDAPAALTETWKYSRTYTYRPEFELTDTYCAENNRDVGQTTGMQTFDLTPPPE